VRFKILDDLLSYPYHFEPTDKQRNHASETSHVTSKRRRRDTGTNGFYLVFLVAWRLPPLLITGLQIQAYA
jgi:hypothetical protein